MKSLYWFDSFAFIFSLHCFQIIYELIIVFVTGYGKVVSTGYAAPAIAAHSYAAPAYGMFSTSQIGVHMGGL